MSDVKTYYVNFINNTTNYTPEVIHHSLWPGSFHCIYIFRHYSFQIWFYLQSTVRCVFFLFYVFDNQAHHGIYTLLRMYRHEITERLLKVALNTITLTLWGCIIKLLMPKYINKVTILKWYSNWCCSVSTLWVQIIYTLQHKSPWALDHSVTFAIWKKWLPCLVKRI